MIYTLSDVYDIMFRGFEYDMPEITSKRINEITRQVGSPDYVKTPVFPIKTASVLSAAAAAKKEKIPSFLFRPGGKQPPPQKRPLVAEKSLLDRIRTHLNKLTDKTYDTMSAHILEEVKEAPAEDVLKISTIVFDLASTNRFYSKIYADLYTQLLALGTEEEGGEGGGVWHQALENQLAGFVSLFDTIETVDPKVNYDRFCEVNKISERRKALASFFVNLSSAIPFETIEEITLLLLDKVIGWVDEHGKKAEVDEVTESVAILVGDTMKKKKGSEEVYTRIKTLAELDVKAHVSMTKKSLFKYSDLLG